LYLSALSNHYRRSKNELSLKYLFHIDIRNRDDFKEQPFDFFLPKYFLFPLTGEKYSFAIFSYLIPPHYALP